MSTIVLKFGSSVLREEADLPTAVHEIYRHVRDGRRVVAVVSAIGDTTDRLIDSARVWCDPADPRILARYLAIGERSAASLLALALGRVGIASAVLGPSEARLVTRGPVLDAEPVGLDCISFARAFEQAPVAVVPGFVGIDSTDGHETLLGRGGSDLTAVFVAARLRAARCILVKDVDGVYTRDPNAAGAPARRYETLSFEDARRVAGELVQSKAIELAAELDQPIEVVAFAGGRGTTIGRIVTRLCAEPTLHRPLGVALLGLGTVGQGVYEYLAKHPGRFAVRRVVVRDPGRRRDVCVPAELLTTDATSVIQDAIASAASCRRAPASWEAEAAGAIDVLLDLRSEGDGATSARDLARALAAGCSVVTSRKDLAADSAAVLEAAARAGGASFRASATVGGGVPMLETVARLVREGRRHPARQLVALEGVLNGTTNHVLDRMLRGSSLEEAVADARERGYAEEDASLDLSGVDAWRKACLLAWATFGIDAPAPSESDARSGLERVDDAMLARARSEGRELRLVARVDPHARGSVVRVRVESLAADSALGLVRGARNILVCRHADGSLTTVFGLGAGRWPTAESVLADLVDELDTRRAASEREVAR